MELATGSRLQNSMVQIRRGPYAKEVDTTLRRSKVGAGWSSGIEPTLVWWPKLPDYWLGFGGYPSEEPANLHRGAAATPLDLNLCR